MSMHEREMEGATEELYSSGVETPPSPERPKLRLVKTVVLSGASNTGKDSLVEFLSERQGWPVFDGTDPNSGFKRRGKSSEQGHIKRSKRAHRRFDFRQRIHFQKLNESSVHTIHQTRLGGINLAIVREEVSKRIGKAIRKNEWLAQRGKPLLPVPQQIPAVSILITATKEVRIKRAYDKSMSAYESQQKRVQAGELIPKSEPILQRPTQDSIAADIDKRESLDVKDWAPMYPFYIREGDDPFRKNLIRPNKGPVYDRVIDTSRSTLEESANELEDILISIGAAEYINPAPQNDSTGAEIKASGDLQANTGLDLSARHGEPMSRHFPEIDMHPDHPSRQNPNYKGPRRRITDLEPNEENAI